MGVYRNYRGTGTKGKVQNQSHPVVVPYPWIPQRQVFALTQPNERGAFFTPGSNVSDQNKPAANPNDDEQFLYTQPQLGTIGGNAIPQFRVSPPGTRFKTGAQPSAVTPFSNTGGGAGGSGGGSGGGGGGAGGGGGRVK